MAIPTPFTATTLPALVNQLNDYATRQAHEFVAENIVLKYLNWIPTDGPQYRADARLGQMYVRLPQFNRETTDGPLTMVIPNDVLGKQLIEYVPASCTYHGAAGGLMERNEPNSGEPPASGGPGVPGPLFATVIQANDADGITLKNDGGDTVIVVEDDGSTTVGSLTADNVHVNQDIICEGALGVGTGGAGGITVEDFVDAGTAVAAGTTVTAGTGIEATTGDIVATAGAVNAGTTVTAGTGITATTGNIAATAGAVSAGTTMAAGTTVTGGTGLIATTGGVLASAGDITATLGNIAASAGSVSAGTTVAAGTTVTAGTGITATTGNIAATAGAVSAGTTVSSGTTMTAGTGLTVTTGNLKVTAGELQGCRESFEFGTPLLASSADAYMNSGGGNVATATFGLPMMRAGSVVGLSASAGIVSHTDGATIAFTARINDVTKITVTTASITENQVYTPAPVTAARGTYTFNAGDLLMVYMDLTGTASWRAFATVEVVYDT